jgi:hypothetical protein
LRDVNNSFQIQILNLLLYFIIKNHKYPEDYTLFCT